MNDASLEDRTSRRSPSDSADLENEIVGPLAHRATGCNGPPAGPWRRRTGRPQRTVASHSPVALWTMASNTGWSIGRRARDHPQDLGRRRLLLERLFRLVEQPDVLDRDHRLVGEGLQELDLPVGERPHLGPPDGDRPDRFGPAQQRHVEHCPEAVGPAQGHCSQGTRSTSACKSGTWIVRRSSTARPAAVPRISGIAPPGVEPIGPSWAAMRSRSPSTWKIVASVASHRRAALVNTASNTGWTSVGELEMTRRISRGRRLLLQRLAQRLPERFRPRSSDRRMTARWGWRP